jgi:hypothetical protein
MKELYIRTPRCVRECSPQQDQVRPVSRRTNMRRCDSVLNGVRLWLGRRPEEIACRCIRRAGVALSLR